MGKILPISLMLNFTPNTKGCYGLTRKDHNFTHHLLYFAFTSSHPLILKPKHNSYYLNRAHFYTQKKPFMSIRTLFGRFSASAAPDLKFY